LGIILGTLLAVSIIRHLVHELHSRKPGSVEQDGFDKDHMILEY